LGLNALLLLLLYFGLDWVKIDTPVGIDAVCSSIGILFVELIFIVCALFSA
jgi:hypothetical protein